MKILMVSSQFAPIVGGVPTVVVLLSREFVKAGCEVKVVTTTPAEENDKFDYEVIRQPKYGDLLRLYRWADVSLHQGCSLHLGWPLLILRKPSFIVHQIWLEEKVQSQFLKGRLCRSILRHSTNLAVGSEVAGSLPVPAKVISNPYDDEVFKILPNVRRDKDLVFIGRLEPEKGADDLIEALGILKRNGLAPIVSIIGYGGLEEKLKTRTKELGLEHLVQFYGKMRPGEELTHLLNVHKVIVVPSRWKEPFGIVALEGIACGCVAIGSTGGGLPEVIGPCGVTFENSNVNRLADAMHHLLGGTVNLDEYRRWRQKHLEQYRAEAIAKIYMKMFGINGVNFRVNGSDPG